MKIGRLLFKTTKMRKRSIIRVKIWEGADTVELLTAGVHAFVKQWLVHPSVIAMHPVTAFKTAQRMRFFGYVPDGKQLSFKGIEILRTNDISEDEIRFY